MSLPEMDKTGGGMGFGNTALFGPWGGGVRVPVRMGMGVPGRLEDRSFISKCVCFPNC